VELRFWDIKEEVCLGRLDTSRVRPTHFI